MYVAATGRKLSQLPQLLPVLPSESGLIPTPAPAPSPFLAPEAAQSALSSIPIRK